MTTARARKAPARSGRAASTAKRDRAAAGDMAELIPASGTGLSAEREIPIALTSRAVFWQPRHLAASDCLVHLPFLFWVMETARPARIVQLGLGDGVVFLSLCQAVDKLGLEAVVMGLECAAGKSPLSPAQTEQHATLYGDFSFLVAEDLARATHHMKGGQIDLLVVNTELSDEVLAILRACWEPLLSERAMLAFLAPETRVTGPEARRYLDGLTHACPSISFPQAGSGLDLVLLGKEQPDRLLRLAALEPGMPGYLAARQVFSRLGQGLEREQSARAKTGALAKAQTALKDSQDRIAALEADIGKLRAEMAAAQAAESEQVALSAGLQAQIFDLTTALEAARENTELEARLAALDDALARKEVEHAEQVQALAAEIERLQGALNEETDRRRGQRRKAETLAAEKAEVEAALAETQSALAEARSARERDMEALTQAHAAETEALQRALDEEAGKRKSHWRRVESLTAEKSALEADLAEARAAQEQAREARQRAHAAEIEALRSEMTARLEEARVTVEALERQLGAARADAAETRELLVTRDSALAEVTAKLEQSEVERRAQAEALAEAAAKLETASRDLGERDEALERMRREVAELTIRAETGDQALQAAEAALVQAREAAGAREQAHAEQIAARDSALAEAAAKLETASRDLGERDEALERMRREVAELTIRAETGDQALQATEAALAQAREAAGAREQAHAELLAARDSALAEAAAKLEQSLTQDRVLRQEHERQGQELASLTRKLIELQEQLTRRLAENGALHDEVVALRNSTSWKVTAPMRRIKQTFT